MKTLHHAGLFLLALGLISGASLSAADAPAPAPAAPPKPAITLHVGDPAPALQVSEWIKGTPVNGFEKGHVYVVEFWATWCGWCKFSMRHLSAMAAKYDGKVTFISMDVLENKPKDGGSVLPKVESFVKSAGDVMSYNIAADTAGDAMKKTWMDASGQGGIPCSFIVDGDGKIAWIGHPALGLEEALPLVLAGKLDSDAIARIKSESDKTVAKVQTYLEVMGEATKKGDAATAVYCADKVMALNTLWNFQAVPGKYMALLGVYPPAATAYAREAIADKTNGPTILMALAAKILDKSNTHPDYALAKEVVDAAMKNSDPTDSGLYPTRALVAFKNGDSAQAVALEKQVLDETTARFDALRKDPPKGISLERINDMADKQLAPIEAALKEYEAGAQAKA
jgi:thiol-disulfide isomerase/thioredoxin